MKENLFKQMSSVELSGSSHSSISKNHEDILAGLLSKESIDLDLGKRAEFYTEGDFREGVKFHDLIYIGNLQIQKSLSSISNLVRERLFQECMDRLEKAVEAFYIGDHCIEVTIDDNKAEHDSKLFQQYIHEDLTVALCPVSLTIKLDTVVLEDQKQSTIGKFFF